MKFNVILPTAKSFKKAFSVGELKKVLHDSLLYYNDNQDDDSHQLGPLGPATARIWKYLTYKQKVQIANACWEYHSRCTDAFEDREDAWDDTMHDILFIIKLPLIFPK